MFCALLILIVAPEKLLSFILDKKSSNFILYAESISSTLSLTFVLITLSFPIHVSIVGVTNFSILPWVIDVNATLRLISSAFLVVLSNSITLLENESFIVVVFTWCNSITAASLSNILLNFWKEFMFPSLNASSIASCCFIKIFWTVLICLSLVTITKALSLVPCLGLITKCCNPFSFLDKEYGLLTNISSNILLCDSVCKFNDCDKPLASLASLSPVYNTWVFAIALSIESSIIALKFLSPLNKAPRWRIRPVFLSRTNPRPIADCSVLIECKFLFWIAIRLSLSKYFPSYSGEISISLTLANSCITLSFLAYSCLNISVIFESSVAASTVKLYIPSLGLKFKSALEINLAWTSSDITFLWAKSSIIDIACSFVLSLNILFISILADSTVWVFILLIPSPVSISIPNTSLILYAGVSTCSYPNSSKVLFWISEYTCSNNIVLLRLSNGLLYAVSIWDDI